MVEWYSTVCIYMFLHVHAYMHILYMGYIGVYMHICVYVCMYTFIYIYSTFQNWNNYLLILYVHQFSASQGPCKVTNFYSTGKGREWPGQDSTLLGSSPSSGSVTHVTLARDSGCSPWRGWFREWAVRSSPRGDRRAQGRSPTGAFRGSSGKL